jgi:hypothetical protein
LQVFFAAGEFAPSVAVAVQRAAFDQTAAFEHDRLVAQRDRFERVVRHPCC